VRLIGPSRRRDLGRAGPQCRRRAAPRATRPRFCERRVKYDAIVIGGGHNGLVCAAYLGRAGLRVLVLEAREAVGGMAATAELLPGVRVPHLAHTVGRLSPVVARELGLRSHGLALVQPAVRVFAPQPDGRAITLWTDVSRTAAELRAGGLAGERDAEAYPAVDRHVRDMARGLAELLSRNPPDVGNPSAVAALDGLRSGLAARARARSTETDLLRALPMAVRDLVGEWFEADALRAAVSARGILYTALGPRAPGTGAVLLTDAAGNDGGLAGQTVYARGGPGALAGALAAAVRANGGQIRTGARVVQVRRSAEQVAGVVLADGEEIEAPIVASNLDPRTTLLDLLEPEVLGPRLSWRASNIRQDGATAKVNYALRALPEFTAAATDTRRLRGRILIGPSMRYLELAARPARHGEIAEQPLLELTIPSLVDPSLVEGRPTAHVMSVVAQAAPYELSDGGWETRRDELGDSVTRTIEQFAPGFSGLVEARQVLTPLDIERELGAAGGHPMHAEVALDQWLEWRPLHGYGRYRLPLDGLYLCGSGAHPGGGVTGSPGRLAARTMLAEMARR